MEVLGIALEVEPLGAILGIDLGGVVTRRGGEQGKQ
jgi:hypothetical protein